MTNSKTIGIVAILIAVIALGITIFHKGAIVAPSLAGVVEQQKKSFIEGFFAGDNRQFEVSRKGTLTQGGGVRATSTSGSAVPLLATDFDTENLIDVTLNIVDATLSFPATSTLRSFLPNAGDTRKLFIRNASTTAAMDLTITGGTGVLLKNASSTAVIVGDTDGANFAIIELIRKANTDIEAIMTPFRD